MEIKFYVIIFIVVFLVGGGLFLKFTYDKAAKDITQRTLEYLIKEKHYKESDIKKIENEQTKGGEAGVLVNVTFVDEPETKYSYQSYDGKITQVAINEGRKAYPKNKHAEVNNGLITELK